MARRADIRIGISGWRYPPWRKVFYPDGLAQSKELAYAAGKFRAIELNGTFYGTQLAASFIRWRDRTPEDFVFTVKAPRFITHVRRLRDVKSPIANFLASGLLQLQAKLGPILWQFPPNFQFDAALFDSFLGLLPHDTEAAARLAQQHDDRLQGRSSVETDKKRMMRHAVEIRHESFRSAEFVKLLRRHKVALVCADTVEWPRLMDVTSDFMYCRLHGSEQLYASGYGSRALAAWARRVEAWASGGEPKDAERVMGPVKTRRTGRDVFVFFDNDVKVMAPADAAALAKRLGAGRPP